MSFDKETIDLVCPRCGYKFGEQHLSRGYEHKVAAWLRGQVCASTNEGFDVWKCVDFPQLTFQVKYSKISYRDGAAKEKDRYPVWNWAHNKMGGDSQADYYILIGIDDNEEEHCFLLSAKQWIEVSSPMGNDKNGRILQMKPQPFSRRGQSRRNPSGYVHENKGWKYEIKKPAENLIERVQMLESFHQFELF